ncbi:hypothetical protein [Actinokineospora iranica]|uniref:Uncharacterized protein n=1 Tax=Actinokineospora iranica TaxID=1271860 RepID=A0A1G6JCK2_9PSEU|nr:hypothetical protein [Actinokineospora iranica]SDC16544.1 hypothetical protein SAMN05216174_101346 [Actinokineospora iranica]
MPDPRRLDARVPPPRRALPARLSGHGVDAMRGRVNQVWAGGRPVERTAEKIGSARGV